MEYVNPEGLRQDGRRPKELRQISCELGVLAKASGSATFEMGNTKVLAAVYGPHEASNRSAAASGAIVQCDYAMAPFSTGERRRQGRTDRRSTEISAVIRNTLEQTIITELLPNSQIDIHVQVLQADGGTRCACINAALLALAEAGIPLRDMVAACAAGYLDETALLDLNYIEDSGGGPDISVALHPQFDRVVLLQMDNRLPLETFESVVELAMKGCKAIASFMREELLEHTRLLAGARAAVNTASTFPGLYLVEAWGRRPLLMFGAGGMAVCQFIVAGIGTGAGISDITAQKALIAFVCIYIFFFACSWGPCAWVVTGEIFPLKVRAKSLSMTTASNWLLNWAIAYATPYLVNSGPGNANLQSKVFFIWGTFCFICFFFVWAMIYETKGLSLEQVDELYAKVDKAWKSKGFVPTVSFQDVKEVQGDADLRKSSLADVENLAMRKKSVGSVGHEEGFPTQEKY